MLESVNIFNEDIDIITLQNIFDIINPVGKIYVQFPQQSVPTQLYNNDKIHSVWEEQLQYNSAFFRSENAPTKVYKADNETQYYLYSNYELIPVSIEGLNAPTVNRSDNITINDKIYYAYTPGSGWRTDVSNNFNSSLQTNQNKIHLHSNTLSANRQPGFGFQNQTAASFVMTFRQGDDNDDGFGVARLTATSGTVSVADESQSSGCPDIQTLNDKQSYIYRYTATHTHTLTMGNMGISITNAYAGTSGDEARPDNYTIRIWKRIA